MQEKSLNHRPLMIKLSRGQDGSTVNHPHPLFVIISRGFPKITSSINSGVAQRSLLFFLKEILFIY